MTQQEIVAERERLHGELRTAQRRVRSIQRELRDLQEECTHPNAVRTSHQSDTCFHCYDCGNCP